MCGGTLDPEQPFMRPCSSHAFIQVKTPAAAAGQRIGLLGGSFNPPHEGHVAVAETGLKRLQLDHVWFLVTPGNPLKSKGSLPPVRERMAACRALIEDRRMVVTGFEAELGCAYTETTVAFLTKRYPGVKFVLLMGGDNLADFHRWRGWRRIAASLPIAVVDRPGMRYRALASPSARALAAGRVPEGDACKLPGAAVPAWTYLSTRLSPLSSTALRGESSST